MTLPLGGLTATGVLPGPLSGWSPTDRLTGALDGLPSGVLAAGHPAGALAGLPAGWSSAGHPAGALVAGPAGGSSVQAGRGAELAATGRHFATGPYPLLVLGATVLALALAVWGLHAWHGGRADRAALVERLASEAGDPGGPGGTPVAFAALDRRVRRYAWGRRLAGRLAATGTNLTPGQFTASVIGLVLGSWVVAAVLLAPFFGPIAALIAGWAAYSFLEWRRRIRTERFIAQLPDLARVLANATQAGLALRTAVSMAADELDAPAGEELKQVADAMALGHSVEDALGELQQRLPSRELIVLVSTLVLSSRAGGSVVESLRNLTVTLEERKETRREIRTQMSQVTVTAYAVPVIGLGSLFLLDRIMPGSLSAMTGSTVGRICVLISLALYVLGFALIRRMSRIDV